MNHLTPSWRDTYLRHVKTCWALRSPSESGQSNHPGTGLGWCSKSRHVLRQREASAPRLVARSGDGFRKPLCWAHTHDRPLAEFWINLLGGLQKYALAPVSRLLRTLPPVLRTLGVAQGPPPLAKCVVFLGIYAFVKVLRSFW